MKIELDLRYLPELRLSCRLARPSGYRSRAAWHISDGDETACGRKSFGWYHTQRPDPDRKYCKLCMGRLRRELKVGVSA